MSEEKGCRICGTKHGAFSQNPLTGEKTCQDCTKKGAQDSHQIEIRRLSQIISSLCTQNEELSREKDKWHSIAVELAEDIQVGCKECECRNDGDCDSCPVGKALKTFNEAMKGEEDE